MEIAVLISWLARLLFACLALLIGITAIVRSAFFERMPGGTLSLIGAAIGVAMLMYAQVSYPLAWAKGGGRMWMQYGPPGVVFESTTYAFAGLLFVLGYATSIRHAGRATSSGQRAETARPVALPDSTTPPTVVRKIAAFRWIIALTLTFLMGLAAGLVLYEPLQAVRAQLQRSLLGTDSEWHR